MLAQHNDDALERDVTGAREDQGRVRPPNDSGPQHDLLPRHSRESNCTPDRHRNQNCDRPTKAHPAGTVTANSGLTDSSHHAARREV